MTVKVITKLVVADRGPLTQKVIETADAMGISTVALYSDADLYAPYVRIADEAVRIDRIDAGDGTPLLAQQLLSQNEVDALLVGGRVVMLTDRYAPVDQMLAPVFREEVPR